MNIKLKKGLGRFHFAVFSFIPVVLLAWALIGNPASTVRAEETPPLSMDEFITDSELLYSPASGPEDYQPLPADGSKIPADCLLKVNCKFDISESQLPALQTGDANPYAVSLGSYVRGLGAPDESLQLTRDDGTPLQFGTLHMSSAGVYVAFVDGIGEQLIGEGYTEITDGTLHFGCQLDKEAIKNAGAGEVELKFGSNTYLIPVETPAAQAMQMEKSGSYDRAKGVVNWKVTIKPGDYGDWENVSFRDEITGGQIYLPDSLKLGGDAVSPDPYDDATHTLTVPLTSDLVSEGKIEFTYASYPPDDAFSTDAANDTALPNRAVVVKDGESAPLAEAEREIILAPGNKAWLSKEGRHIAGDNKIEWKVTIHTNGYTPGRLTLHDELPAELTLTGDVMSGGNALTVTPTTGPGGFAAEIDGPVEGQTVTYTTLVDENCYKPGGTAPSELGNKVWLTFDWDRHDGTNTVDYATPEVGIGVGVAPSPIIKNAKNYDPATQTITWEIVVNQHHIDLKNVTVTDELGPNQDIIPGQTVSYALEDGSGGRTEAVLDAASVSGDNTADPKKVVFTFPATGKNKIIFQYQTKVNHSGHFGTNSSADYTNKALLSAILNETGEPSVASEDSATQRVQSKVLEKASLGYDYAAKCITWKITVNQNGMPMKQAVVKDPLPAGLSLSPDTAITVNGSPIPLNPGGGAAPPYADCDSSGNLQIFLGDIDAGQEIKIPTSVDMQYFNTAGSTNQNAQFTIENTARLEYRTEGGDDLSQESRARQTIHNQSIGKAGTLDDSPPDGARIKYTIIVNPNGLKLERDSVITDQLPRDAGENVLELDLSSVRLEKGSVDAGNRFTGVDVGDVSSMYQYNASTDNVFTFRLPAAEGDTDSYRLSYEAEIVKNVRVIKNSASFNGTGVTGTGSSQVDFSAGGGGGGAITQRKASIRIEKTDNDSPGRPLSGAVFEVLLNGGVVKESITGTDGAAAVTGLKANTAYKIREKTPPAGYQPNTEVKEAIAKTGSEIPTVTFVDLPLCNDITFTTTNDFGEKVAGAEFALCDSSGIDLAPGIPHAFSDANGLVSFRRVPFGVYRIKAIRAPGHETNTGVFTAEIDMTTGDFAGLKDESGDPVTVIVNKKLPDPDPGPSDPDTPDPGPSDPGTPDPGPSDPDMPDPGPSDPGTPDPGPLNPGTAGPGPSNPGPSHTENAPDSGPSGWEQVNSSTALETVRENLQDTEASGETDASRPAGEAPGTGDTTPILLFAAFLLIGGAGLAWIGRKWMLRQTMSKRADRIRTGAHVRRKRRKH